MKKTCLRKSLALLVGASLIAVLVGCADKKEPEEEILVDKEEEAKGDEEVVSEEEKSPEEVALEVIMKNAQYLKEEDIDKYLSTMYFPEELLEESKMGTSLVFSMMDLDYEITEPVYEEVTEDKVVVKVKRLNRAEVVETNETIVPDDVLYTVEKFGEEWLVVSADILGSQQENGMIEVIKE